MYLLRARFADDPVTAESQLLAGVAHSRNAGDVLGLVDALELLAALAVERGEDAEAVWAAASVARQAGLRPPSADRRGPPGPHHPLRRRH